MFFRDKNFLIKTILLIGLVDFQPPLTSSEKILFKEPVNQKIEKIKWVKIKENKSDQIIKWSGSEEPSFFDNEGFFRAETEFKNQYRINSLNRSLVFDNNIIGPDVSWLVPPGFAWNKRYKFDGSVRGHSRRKGNEKFLKWNGGDAVGQFYYQFLHLEKSSLGVNLGVRSVYSGDNFIGGRSPIGDGLSTGFRWDYEISSRSGVSFGAEQLLHFDGKTDTGRDIYFTYSKGWWNQNIEGLFPLYTFTGGIGTGKLAEGAIKGMCSDLLGGNGINIKEKGRLCWAPIFSVAMVNNESFSTFLEYNSNSLILGSSLTPFNNVPLRGTFAVKLADEDNYEINDFSEMTWIFRASLGF